MLMLPCHAAALIFMRHEHMARRCFDKMLIRACCHFAAYDAYTRAITPLPLRRLFDAFAPLLL